MLQVLTIQKLPYHKIFDQKFKNYESFDFGWKKYYYREKKMNNIFNHTGIYINVF